MSQYTLIGSYPSPYVRRIRLLMAPLDFEFKAMDIYQGEGKEELKKYSAINQIPVLLDGDKKIWDSRIIYNYLNEKHKLENKLTWEQENILTAIERGLDASINLFMLKKSQIIASEEHLFYHRQKARIESVFDFLSPWAKDHANEWSFHMMTLYSFLDWGLFRDMISIEKRPEFKNILLTHSHRSDIQATQIPKA